MHTANTITVSGELVHFPYGDIKRVYSIAEYTIVEYAKIRDGRTRYYAYVEAQDTGVEYMSLDQALLGALMHKYTAQKEFRKRVIEYLVQALCE